MPEVPPTSPWIFRPQRRPNARLRLYCFPYAGGAAYAYTKWAELFPHWIEVRAVELPGRGPRVKEPLFSRFDPLLDAVQSALKSEWSQSPFALYGHSMGGLIAFELTRRLRRDQVTVPVALVISGRPAPGTPETLRAISNASDDALWQHLRSYNGTPNELLDNPEIRQLFLPILRADFSVVENYGYVVEPPVTVPIVAAIGTRDPSTPAGSELAWLNATTGTCRIRRYDGDHFFIRSHTADFVRDVSNDLLELLPT